ncbi:hypothetical protein DQ384_39335 [Sphaerisporangium album]|uniref:Uncharacterized protein n=1 Tax=Sphaerisporangium album TaxID=509200 RepID=A0A367EJF6_9ACTN|nr:hypothetical protein DQ384_39335 [Sphaerisporangium album]
MSASLRTSLSTTIRSTRPVRRISMASDSAIRYRVPGSGSGTCCAAPYTLDWRGTSSPATWTVAASPGVTARRATVPDGGMLRRGVSAPVTVSGADGG